jgi:hypothetical protein
MIPYQVSHTRRAPTTAKGELRGRRETFIDDLFAGRVAQVVNAPVGRPAIASALSAGGYPEAVARKDAQRRGRWFEEYVAIFEPGFRTEKGL